MNQYKAAIAYFMVPAIALNSLLIPAVADVSTDGTLGAVIDFTGPDFVIPESAGALAGDNLFHSFSRFDLASDQSATFTGNAGINNVIGRITGGTASTVDGAVTNTISGSNLYLLNPDGIVFGENAVINVDGSFYAGTADYLVLGNNQGRFDATNVGDTVLSSAPPSAFGFLADSPSRVGVYGAGFALADGATLGLVAGDVLVSGAADSTFNPDGTADYRIELNDGSVHLAAINQAAEYVVATPDVGAIDSLGDVTLQQAGISVYGDSAGTVYIRAGRLTISDGFANVINEGGVDHGQVGIDIVANQRVDIEYTGTANFRALLTNASSTGSAGDIRISTGVLSMRGNAGAAGSGGGRVLIHSVTQSSALGGDIEINAGRINLRENVSIQAEAVGTGDAGDIRIMTDRLSLRSASLAPVFISANAFSSVGAAGGDIEIQAGAVELLRGADGFVGITAQGLAATPADRADGGNINMTTDSLLLMGGAQMTTSVFQGTGRAGNIDIQAGSVEVAGFSPAGFRSTIGSTSEGGANTSGAGGVVSINAGDIHLHDYGRVTTFADTFGNAGDIALTAGSLRVERGAELTSVNIGAGIAGEIGIDADRILLKGDHGEGFRTGVFALSGAFGAGSGNIGINATALEVLGGAQINSDTNGAGSGGVIDINSGELTVAGSNDITGEHSSISSRTLPFMDLIGFATGDAGTININSDTVNVIDNGLITSESNASGDGGNVNISADRLILRNGGGVSAAANSQGNAGQINIDAVALSADGGLIATASRLSSGGDISIQSDTLVLNNATHVSSTTAGDFNGGDIVIDAGRIQINSDSRVTASTSGDGNSGNIRFLAGSVDMNTASLEATGSRKGLAGNIDLSAQDSINLVDSRIFTEAELSDGGNIRLAAVEQVYLKDSVISSSVSDGFGNGGNIDIDPVFVILDNSSIIADANGGDGGNISIRTDHFIASPDSVLSASSALGVDGNVVIDTPSNNLSDTLDKLPQKAVDTSALVSGHCGEIGKGRSSFIVRNIQAAPPDYLAPIASRYDLDGDAGSLELTLDGYQYNQAHQCG